MDGRDVRDLLGRFCAFGLGSRIQRNDGGARVERDLAPRHPKRPRPPHHSRTELAPLVHGLLRCLGGLRLGGHAILGRRGASLHRRRRVPQMGPRDGHQLRVISSALESLFGFPWGHRHVDGGLPAVCDGGRRQQLPKHRLPQRWPRSPRQLHRATSDGLRRRGRQQRSQRPRQPALHAFQPRVVHRVCGRQPLACAAQPLAEHQPEHFCGTEWHPRNGDATVPEPGVGERDAVWAARQHHDPALRQRRVAVSRVDRPRRTAPRGLELRPRHRRPLHVGPRHGAALV